MSVAEMSYIRLFVRMLHIRRSVRNKQLFTYPLGLNLLGASCKFQRGNGQSEIPENNFVSGLLKVLHIARLSQHPLTGHYLPASETPFGWRFAGRPIVV